MGRKLLFNKIPDRIQPYTGLVRKAHGPADVAHNTATLERAGYSHRQALAIAMVQTNVKGVKKADKGKATAASTELPRYKRLKKGTASAPAAATATVNYEDYLDTGRSGGYAYRRKTTAASAPAAPKARAKTTTINWDAVWKGDKSSDKTSSGLTKTTPSRKNPTAPISVSPEKPKRLYWHSNHLIELENGFHVEPENYKKYGPGSAAYERRKRRHR